MGFLGTKQTKWFVFLLLKSKASANRFWFFNIKFERFTFLVPARTEVERKPFIIGAETYDCISNEIACSYFKLVLLKYCTLFLM